MARRPKLFATEADLCRAFIGVVSRDHPEWVAYPETAGWDILLSRKADGLQIGIQAKLKLNPKVVDQAIPHWRRPSVVGPDHRAVLVPAGEQGEMTGICGLLGITVITQAESGFGPRLPELKRDWWDDDWHHWCPAKRCELPDYVPDVEAGDSAPVQLTPWKVKAIKLAILLEERPVTRADIKALGLSPNRWLDRYTGWLTPTPQGYVPKDTMPDFKAQHPRNYEEIKADRQAWMAELPKELF